MAFASAGQLGLIAASVRRLGRRYRLDDYRLDWLSDRVGRVLDSSAELTEAEAGAILRRLRRSGHLRRKSGPRLPSPDGAAR